MKLMDGFWASEQGKTITLEQRPQVEMLLKHFGNCYNQGVDACLELVRKYGEVKQLMDTKDFLLLLEFLEKIKEDVS